MRTSALSLLARRILPFCFAITLILTGSALGQGNPQSLGLKPPTQSELDWMDRNLKKTDKVRLNELGLRRLNEDRVKRGLPRVTTSTVSVGLESVGAGPGVSEGGQTVGATTGVPGTVDNSTLDCFPPVRNQGSIGSCCSFATSYYVGTHMTGLVRGWNNKNDADNTRKFSPKWTYNFVNGGGDNGSWYSSTMDVLLKMGCATWSDLQYDGNSAVPLSYLSWQTGESVWRNAINYRFSQAGRVQNVDTATGVTNMKALLNNGYLLLYATDIYGWQFTQFSNDPATNLDDALVGRKVCSIVKSNSSGHAMTIVGYSDTAWTDINKNGAVDTGEKGAFKIVNSWGNNWGTPGFPSVTNDGFAWIAYDALKTVSAVAGADNANRASGYRSAFWGSEVYWITARASYTPSLLGRFTISHARRSDLSVRLGTSTVGTTTPASYFPLTTTFDFQNSFGQPEVFKYLGGNYGLNGQAGNTTAANMVFDFTDLVQTGNRRYYLEVNDRTAGTAANVSDFRLVSAAGTTIATATIGIPLAADNSTSRAYVDLSLGSAPVINSSTNASGTVGNAFSFNVTALNSPTSYGANGLPPGLTINTSTGQITGTPTQAGTSTASLSATNANGTGSGSLTIAINPAAINPPVITSATTKTGTVGQALSYTITASNTPSSYGATNLPPGVTVNTSTGAISGTPTQAGDFEATLSASNAGGTGTRGLSITIDPPPAIAPVITSASTASGASGSAFTYRITATNTPNSFAADNLPPGLSLNTSTGDITGVLPVARSYDITLSAANGGGTGYKTLTLTVTGDSSFGPANDSFANRIEITGQSDTVAGSNVNATTETGEPAHAGSAASKSVWWTWTAPVDGSVTISTAGSTFSTRLAAYTGSAVNGLTAEASAASSITFAAEVNVTYQIAVDGAGGATGDITLALNQTGGSPDAPGNDNFDDAIALTGSSATVTAGNANATDEPGEPAHADNLAECSVWWTWTATADGTVVLDTIGSNFDTVLAVYTGTTVGTLSLVKEDDQGGGNNTSKVTFPVTNGTVYRIAVDGWEGVTGAIALRLAFASGSAPVNDNFAGGIALTTIANSATTSGTSVNATAEENEPSHAGYLPAKSVWWKWTATGSGSVTLDTIGSNFDTTLSVYTGSPVDALTEVESDDDGGGGRTSKVTFLVASGITYQFAVDGYAKASGSISLNLVFTPDLTSNDNFANRATLEEAAQHASNTAATAEVGEPNHAGNSAAKSIWWKWTAATDGRVLITTAGSDFDTVLGVYKGFTVGSLESVAENDDGPSGRTSEVTFFAAAGTEYQIAVDGYLGATGQALLAVISVEGSDLYFTDFEDFPSGLDTIEGTDGWRASGSTTEGASGIFVGFDGSGKTGWVGYNAASDELLIWRPINYVPQSASKALVRFSVDIAIRDSTDGKYDSFDFTLYNTNTTPTALGRVTFNNNTLEIERSDGVTAFGTGVFFSNAQKYRLTIDMNFATNRWTAYLDNDVIFENQPINSESPTPQLSLGDLDIGLYRANATSGNNVLIFDNYRLTVLSNEPAPPPSNPPTISTKNSRINTQRTSVSVKGTVTVPGSALARVRYRVGNGSWKNVSLSGSGVVRTFDVRIKNLRRGRTSVLFEATDVLGRTVRDRVKIERN